MQNTPPTKRAQLTSTAQNQAVKNQPEWSDEKFITRNFGLGHTSLYNLRLAGKIRTTSTRAEGMNRGKRLFHVQSVRDFLEAQEINEMNSNKEGAAL
jgi:hypothetical protein